MDRQNRSFFAVVALVGAIFVTIYHFISGNPIGDYWLAGVLFILAVLIWIWPSDQGSKIFDRDPALRGNDSPEHAKEAYSLNLVDEAPHSLGDAPDVAPPEFDTVAMKVLQDSQIEERLTEIVETVDATEISETAVEEAIIVEELVIDETVAEETVIEEAEPVEVVATDADAPVEDAPLPDYAEAQIITEEDSEATTETIQDAEANGATDAPEPYSVASDEAPAEEAPVAETETVEATTEPEAVAVEEESSEESPVAETETVEATTEPEVVAVEDESSTVSAQVETDTPEAFDLTKIEGIGVKYQEALNGAGITTFEQLAELSVEQLIEIAQSAGMRRAGSMETWAEQAKLAAADKWDELQILQDKLIGGRREG